MNKIQHNKPGLTYISEALVKFGVKYVVSSPGSRNAPLLLAFERTKELHQISIIDERSAAFHALGIAQTTGAPVAICCTSGSAMLNYAPAIAEAYNKHLPLVVITADRPQIWIDQNDNQTIRQAGALTNITKKDCILNVESSADEDLWALNRTLNEALTAAVTPPCAPVHINIPLSEPLTSNIDPICRNQFQKIETISPSPVIDNLAARQLAQEISEKKTLFIAGFYTPNDKLNNAVNILTQLPNSIVIAEGLSNLHSPHTFLPTKRTLSYLADNPPELIISWGGGIVSSALKTYLRQLPANINHWYISQTDNIIDTYCHLSRHFNFAPEHLLSKVAHSLLYIYKNKKYTIPIYANLTNDISENLSSSEVDIQYQAIDTLLKKLPKQWNIHISNGLTLRSCLKCFDLRFFHRIDCNRGVSGIDGCTSTAIGASAVFPGTTLLISGDMSSQYDIAALASPILSPRFKMVVINNNGGHIFRKIKSTYNLPEREKLFCGNMNLPLKQLADAYKINYFSTSYRSSEFEQTIEQFINTSSKPALLEILINENETVDNH